MDSAMIEARAAGLIGELATWSHDIESQSAEPSIYDTAWVAMLCKPDNAGAVEWTFPTSFEFLLNRQQPSGGWMTCHSKVDTILNTLAATLALTKHRKSLGADQNDVGAALDSRASRAVAFLYKELTEWKLEASSHVGFELLVPALLSMLELENIHLPFSSREDLMTLHKNRLANFHPEELCKDDPSSMLYLLEAFIGLVETEKLSHHKVQGSIMRSPSSTAAYLMGLQVWDEECETYLRTAIQATGTSGGVPSVFPCRIMEQVCIVEMLLRSGFSRACIGVDSITSIITPVYENGGMAKIIPGSGNLHFSVLVRPAPSFSSVLIWSSETPFDNELSTQFLLGNRSSSDTANTQVGALHDQIINDVLNLSPFYSMMLFAEGFAEMYRLSHDGSLELSGNRIVEERAPVAMVQILAKTLSTQNNDGSWGPKNCAETTAYAILALIAFATVPYVGVLITEIRYAVARGREALSLMTDAWPIAHHLWVGKTIYGSPKLSEAYSIAAMKKPLVEHVQREETTESMQKLELKVLAFSKFFGNLDNLTREPLFLIKASVLEGLFYQSALRAKRTEVFPPTRSKEEDKYLNYIPIMWTLPSTCRRIFSPPEYLLDMMVLSMFIFLVDEYMESNVAKFNKAEFAAFRESVDEVHHKKDSSERDFSAPGFLQGQLSNESVDKYCTTKEPSNRLREAVSIFQSFGAAVMEYPRVAGASQSDLLELRSETKNYLLHHITQLEDNVRFAQQPHHPGKTTEFTTPRISYHTWVHTVGAGHVSGPFSFAFFACSMGGSVRGEGSDCFQPIKQKLMAHAMNDRIGAFCRMYNDYGSIVRDRDERNLNSVNFPEFFLSGSASHGGQEWEDEAKATLLECAKYERQCALDGAEVLLSDLEAEGAAGKKVANCLRVYMGACEQFSDMYVIRDVTNRVR